MISFRSNCFMLYFLHFFQALAEAIRSVTDMNPDLSVEKIEIRTESEMHS